MIRTLLTVDEQGSSDYTIPERIPLDGVTTQTLPVRDVLFEHQPAFPMHTLANHILGQPRRWADVSRVNDLSVFDLSPTVGAREVVLRIPSRTTSHRGTLTLGGKVISNDFWVEWYGIRTMNNLIEAVNAHPSPVAARQAFPDKYPDYVVPEESMLVVLTVNDPTLYSGIVKLLATDLSVFQADDETLGVSVSCTDGVYDLTSNPTTQSLVGQVDIIVPGGNLGNQWVHPTNITQNLGHIFRVVVNDNDVRITSDCSVIRDFLDVLGGHITPTIACKYTVSSPGGDFVVLDRLDSRFDDVTTPILVAVETTLSINGTETTTRSVFTFTDGDASGESLIPLTVIGVAYTSIKVRHTLRIGATLLYRTWEFMPDLNTNGLACGYTLEDVGDNLTGYTHATGPNRASVTRIDGLEEMDHPRWSKNNVLSIPISTTRPVSSSITTRSYDL